MPAIIPLPARVEERTGSFRFTGDLSLCADPLNRANAEYLQAFITTPKGARLPILPLDRLQENRICFQSNRDLTELGDEGYRLEILPRKISILSASPSGVFHGIQTLRQLLPSSAGGESPSQENWEITCVLIEDKPRFRWRGFMLDEARHFQGMETVLRTLDIMALLKLNIFHWHLTDDQGWRLESKKYPRLTDIGSQREGTSQSMLSRKHDGVPHSGYYTQGEIRAIVDYAAARHVTIIPEIEIPGHSLAALAAYPELSCTGGPFQVATHFGIYKDIYCAGKETTFKFLEEILDEVMTLFPTPIIHIGGDEAPKTRWKRCPDCQQRMKEENIANEHDLQTWFTNRIAQHLEANHHQLMGWNQILGEGLNPSAIVQYWMGDEKKLIDAIRKDHRPVVMSTYLDTYLDHSYNLMPLQRAYAYEPVPRGLSEEEAESILGLEYPLWGEWTPTRARLDYQAYPRVCALAEVAWTPKEARNYADFTRRLEHFLVRLERLGVQFAALKEAQPPKWKRWFSIFTIAMPQRKVAAQAESKSRK